MLRPHAAVRAGAPPCLGEGTRAGTPRPLPVLLAVQQAPRAGSRAGRPGGGTWEGPSSCALGAQPPSGMKCGARPPHPASPRPRTRSVNSSLKTTRGPSGSRVRPSDSRVCTMPPRPRGTARFPSTARPAPDARGGRGPAGTAHTRAHCVRSRHPLPTGTPPPPHTQPPLPDCPLGPWVPGALGSAAGNPTCTQPSRPLGQMVRKAVHRRLWVWCASSSG